jgi:threonine/homoserine/homoserine lactone efflux protein
MAYEEQREKSRRRMDQSSGLLNLFMGFLMIAVGIIIFKKDHFNLARIVKFFDGSDPFLIQIFGGLWILYGVWRLFRGYNKMKN